MYLYSLTHLRVRASLAYAHSSQTHLHQQQTSTPHASLASISFTSTFHKLRKNFFSGLNSSLLLNRQEFLSTIIFISSQTHTIDIRGHSIYRIYTTYHNINSYLFTAKNVHEIRFQRQYFISTFC